MRRTFKITQKQLSEADNGIFQYLDGSSDIKPTDGQVNITAGGKLNGFANSNPITSDMVGNQMTPQSWSRYRMYGNLQKYPYASDSRIGEGVAIKNGNDVDGNGVDDFYDENSEQMDTLSNGDSDDNLTVIPDGVDYKITNLLQVMTPLNPRQKAMVLNKIIESTDLSGIPYPWKKALMYKMLSKK